MTTNTYTLNKQLTGSLDFPQAGLGKAIARMVAAVFGSRLVLKERDNHYDFSKPQNQKNYLTLHGTMWL